MAERERKPVWKIELVTTAEAQPALIWLVIERRPRYYLTS